MPKHDAVLEHCAKIIAKKDPHSNPQIAADERGGGCRITVANQEEANLASRYKDGSKTERGKAAVSKICQVGR